ncbi:hypothetical protein [Halorussus salinisoli]|uniref:hypothetical protein n=1 Tax=Halorussus salinisoli TaxID=2558242 RepID=UPI0010C20DC1|nr:hypothetical protein [Halorussus salinisoli]
MALSRRELLGYAVAGTTGMGITTAAQDSGEPGVGQRWQLGGVYARPAEIGDTAVTFRASAESQYVTDYEVEVVLFYRPKRAGGESNPNDSNAAGDASAATSAGGGEWRKLDSETGPLAEDVYLEATAEGLEPGRTYEYRAEAYLTNYDGQSRRVSETFAVTAGDPCSGPSTNCLRVETLAPETSDDGSAVTLHGTARGLDAYDEVTGHFFYQREDGEKNWTDYVPIDDEGDSGEFSATLSDLPAGSYTYYAEARGEGGGLKNMYGEGRERRFRVE